MAGYAELLQNNPLVFVPLSPLLNNGFNMLFQHGQQQRAEAQAAKAQKKADLWGGLGMAKDVALTGTTLGVLGAGLGGGGGGEGAEAAADALGGGTPDPMAGLGAF